MGHKATPILIPPSDMSSVCRVITEILRNMSHTLDQLVDQTVAGGAMISGAATTVHVTFQAAQPNTNYVIQVSNPIAEVGTPALTSAYAVNFSTTGFDIQVAAAPGAGNTYFVPWVLTRLDPYN
jgi:hypothetical protein